MATAVTTLYSYPSNKNAYKARAEAGCVRGCLAG